MIIKVPKDIDPPEWDDENLTEEELEDISYHQHLIEVLKGGKTKVKLPENMDAQEWVESLSQESWAWISCKLKLSEDLIRKFEDQVDWYWISYCQHLSEDFIREFKDKVKWYDISYCQTLSENFIREFKDEVDWDVISFCQTLSVNFIREFKNKLSWDSISRHQILSEDFIREFKDKIDWEELPDKRQYLKELIISEEARK